MELKGKEALAIGKGKQKVYPLLYHQLRSSLFTATFAMVVLGALIYHVSEQTVLKTVQDSLKYHAEFRIDRIESLFNNEKAWLLQIAANRKLRRDLVRYLNDRDQQQEVHEGAEELIYEMRQIQRQNTLGTMRRGASMAPNRDLLIFDVESRLLASSAPDKYQIELGELVDSFLGDTPPPLVELMDRIKLSGKVEVSKYGFSYLAEQSMVWIGMPVYSPYQREMMAILVSPFPLEELRNLIESYSGLGQSGEVLVAHWRGEPSSGGLTFLNHFRNLERRQPDHDCIVLRERSSHQFPMTRALTMEDGDGWVLESSCRDAYAIWRWLPDLRWGLVVKQDREEMMAPVERLQLQIGLVSLGLFVFVFFMSFRQAKLLARPIVKLKDAVLNESISSYAPGKVREVNSLAKAFRNFSQEVINRSFLLEEQSKEMERSKQETDLIIEVMDEGLLVLNRDEEIIRSNPKVVSMTGIPQSELRGLHFGQLFDSKSMLANRTGEPVPVHVVRSRLNTHGLRSAAEVVVLSDLSEMLNAENAVRANRAKDQFLAMMSHELRTPLTSIIGYAEILGKSIADQLSEKQATMLHSIAVSGRTQLTLINDILDLSKIEAGKFEIVDEEYVLTALLDELDDIFSLRAREAGVAFLIKQEVQLEHQLVGDSVRIGQILMNLLSNAVKFTEQGQISLSVVLEQESQRICFKVEDSGFGMSPEVLDRLFKPFEQADNSITRKFGGTGLGLNISWNLVEMMGGEISVESEVGVGSCFTVKLPFRPSEKRVPDRVEHGSLSAQVQFQGRVLLVEDTPELQVLVEELLSTQGVEVVLASDGQEGVERALSEGFDLVLMDKHMPAMDGIEATQTLRLAGFNKPIYALTADMMKGQQEELIEAGCDGVLGKPIDETLLRKMLRNHLEQVEQSTAPAVEESSIDPVIARLKPLFLERLGELSAEISQALEVEDEKQLAELVHIVKGAAGSYGYGRLGDAAAEIDRMLKEQQEQEVIFKKIRMLLDMAQQIVSEE